MSTRLVLTLFGTLLATVIVACQQGSFDPSGPCDRDGRMAGAYPDLEARVPASFQGRPPDQLDSGRNCTPASLGPLAGLGIDEVRYAGGLWETDAQSGVTLAVFQADGLDAEKLLAFYEAGARASRRVGGLTTREVAYDGRSLQRLDALNDASDQTIITWQDGDVVRAILVADSVAEVASKLEHEQTVEAALEAAGA